MKKQFVLKTVAAGVLIGLASLAHADVTIDENGIGFVGKGDVQSVFDWNNAQLQENAADIQFRLGSGIAATWQCQNPGRGTVNIHDYQSVVSADIAVDTRKNRVGQVTGFILNGFGESSTIGIGDCPNNNWTLLHESIQYLQDGEASSALQVSIDGENWFDLE